MANQQLNNVLGGLFAGGTQQQSNAGGNALSITNALTTQSEGIARQILETISADVAKYQEAVNKSKESHDVMDDLINEIYNLKEVDVDYIRAVGEDEIDKAIKSQQSKRSRSKSKNMTMDNYITLMTAAVAENLLRIASGKPKSAGGGSRRTDIGYSEEELQKLANDQEALKKEIRNVQSKKCIMKSRSDFNEQSEDFKKLLEAEETLKSLRTGTTNPQAAKAIETTDKIHEALASIGDVNSLKGNDAKELLAKIREMLATK